VQKKLNNVFFLADTPKKIIQYYSIIVTSYIGDQKYL